MNNQWLEQHNKRLSQAQLNMTRAVSGLWLALLRDGTLDLATLTMLKTRASELKEELDALVSDAELVCLQQRPSET